MHGAEHLPIDASRHGRPVSSALWNTLVVQVRTGNVRSSLSNDCLSSHTFAGDPYARHGLPRRYRQIRVGLVVAELHVETGIELLDPRVFESERLQFGADDRPFEATCGEHHRLRARMQQIQRLEVVGQPVAQAFRLADVDHASFAVPPFVDSGLGGDISGLRPEQVARVPQQRSPVPVHFGDRIRSVRLPAQRIGRFSPHFG